MTEKRGRQPDKKTENRVILIGIVLLAIVVIAIVASGWKPSTGIESQITVIVVLKDKDGNEIPYDATEPLTLIRNRAQHNVFVGPTQIIGIAYRCKVMLTYQGTPTAKPRVSWEAPQVTVSGKSPVTYGTKGYSDMDAPSGQWVEILGFNFVLDTTWLETNLPDTASHSLIFSSAITATIDGQSKSATATGTVQDVHKSAGLVFSTFQVTVDIYKLQ